MTTINQSKRLLACGISPDTADMCIGVNHGKREVAKGVFAEIPPRQMATPYSELDAETLKCWDEIIPAWSLNTMMTKVLPQTIAGLVVVFSYKTGKWWAEYRDTPTSYAKLAISHDEPNEVCVLMAELLHQLKNS